MRQQSYADGGLEKYWKKTRKEIFLEEMDQIIPWKALSKAIKAYYPKPKTQNPKPKTQRCRQKAERY